MPPVPRSSIGCHLLITPRLLSHLALLLPVRSAEHGQC